MQATNIKTEEAPNKWWAARDARMRNYANSTRYTEQQKIAAERMKLALEIVYSAKAVYIAYGKTGISLKVDGARIRDRKELALMEEGWSMAGFVKKVSPQGVIYRFTVRS
jgi:hypothetical protein